MGKSKAAPKPKIYCANPDCKKTIAKPNETICWECRRQVYRLSLRIKCSNYFDDKCQNCGFVRETIEDLNKFDFHHKNMQDKEFTISDSIIRNNWDEIRAELDKCTMLCKFCHADRHAIIRNGFIKNKAIILAQEGQ